MGFLLEERLNVGSLPSSGRLMKSSGYTARSSGGTRGGSSAGPSEASSSRFFRMRFARMRAEPDIFARAVRTRRDGASRPVPHGKR